MARLRLPSLSCGPLGAASLTRGGRPPYLEAAPRSLFSLATRPDLETPAPAVMEL